MTLDDAVREKIHADYTVASRRCSELERVRNEFRPEEDGDVVTCATVVTPKYLDPVVDEAQQVPYGDGNSEQQYWENLQECLSPALAHGIVPGHLLAQLEEVPDYVANLSNAPTD